MEGPIVVGVDGSPEAGQAVTQAVGIAAATAVPLHLVAVRADRHAYAEPADDDARHQVQVLEQALEDAGQQAAKGGAPSVHMHRRYGDPAEEIRELAIEIEAELIAVGGGRIGSVVRFLLGSVADTISHHPPCDVLIAAPPPVVGDEPAATG